MSSKILERQLNNLTHEMVLLRSVIIGVIGEKDPEGEYRPEFVSRIIEFGRKKKTGIKFTTPGDLLKMIS